MAVFTRGPILPPGIITWNPPIYSFHVSQRAQRPAPISLKSLGEAEYCICPSHKRSHPFPSVKFKATSIQET